MNEIQEIGDAFTEAIRWKAVEDLGYSKEKIEQNQKIVDELLKCYSECRSRQANLAISQYETDQQLFMEKLYKKSTGKNIQEIQFQPKVADEN